MGQLGPKMRRIGPAEGYTAGGLAHWCPACESMHQFALDGKNSCGAQWTWDGNVEAPTFAPSMNIVVNSPSHPHHQKDAATSVCHYFLRAGQLQFLGDCTHAMRGRMVQLPDLPLQLTDRYLGPQPAEKPADQSKALPPPHWLPEWMR